MAQKIDEQDPKALAAMAVDLSRKKGAQAAAASANRRREVEITWRDGKLEKISEATSRGLYIQLYVDGRYSVANTSDLRPAALPLFLDNAVAMTRALAKDAHRALPDPALYAGQSDADLMLLDGAYNAVSAEERRRRAHEIETAARAQPGAAAILSVTSQVSDVLSEVHRVTSNGFSGSQSDTQFWMSAEVSVKDDARRPEDYAVAGGRLYAGLPGPGVVGSEAARRALSRRGAKKGASALLPMVVDPRAGGRLVSFLLAPLNGQALQQGRSCFQGKLGTAIGSPLLTVTDDPLLPRGLGSRRFDNEGIAARRVPLFEGGVLRNYYVDNYYGRKLKMAPTTGRVSNLSWGPSSPGKADGRRDQAALLADIKDGVLVTGFLGGNSNSTTGDFSLGVLGVRIRNGKPAEPVGEMNISGNHLELWQHLVALGNDPYPYSPLRTPSLVFDKVQFAGT